MTDGRDVEIEIILDRYDQQHAEREETVRRAETAGASFDLDFRKVIADVVRPYFEEVAVQLEAHGHSALVEEGSVSSPDHRLAGGSKITLAFLPKERAKQGLRHQLELNDAPHLMLRCDKVKRVVEVFQEPDPGITVVGQIFRPDWQLADVTRRNLRSRVVPMIEEVLNPPAQNEVNIFPLLG